MQVTRIPIAEVEATLLRRLDALQRRHDREALEERRAAAAAAAAEADRMRAAGLCP